MADAPNDTLNRVKDTAEKAQATAREGAERTIEAGREGFRKATADATRVANQGLEMGSQAIEAYVEAGRQAANALGDVNRAATDAYNRSLADFEELSRQALNCRTAQDLIELQSLAIQKMQDNFNDATKVYTLYFNAFAKSAQPITTTAAEFRDRAQAAAKTTTAA